MYQYCQRIKSLSVFSIVLTRLLVCDESDLWLYFSAIDEKGRFFNAFIFAFGFIGFWSQIWSGFTLPFPLNIILIPVRLAEWSLRVLVFMLG